MTWNQQIRGLKRRLTSEQLQATWKRKRHEREGRQAALPCPPVIVAGEVSQEFLERMRTMGVRVVVV